MIPRVWEARMGCNGEEKTFGYGSWGSGAPGGTRCEAQGAVTEKLMTGRTRRAGKDLRPGDPGQAGASRRVERRPLPLLPAPQCVPDGSGGAQAWTRVGSLKVLGSLKGSRGGTLICRPLARSRQPPRISYPSHVP